MRTSPRPAHPRKGWALLSALVAVLIVAALSAGLIRAILASHREIELQEHLAQADQLAESARIRVATQLQKTPNYTGEVWKPAASGGSAMQATITVTGTGASPQARVVCLVPADVPHPVRVERAWSWTPAPPSETPSP